LTSKNKVENKLFKTLLVIVDCEEQFNPVHWAKHIN